MKMFCVYLSGPMRGINNFNYPAFHAKARELRSLGYTVYNPAEFEHDGPLEEFPLADAFAEFTNYICLVADAVFALPGTEFSMGAKAEIALARAINLPVVHRIDELQGIARMTTKR